MLIFKTEFISSFLILFINSLSNLDLLGRDDFSKRREYVEIKIEGLTSLESLQIGSNPDEIKLSLKNLPSLTCFSTAIYTKLDENIFTQLLDQLHDIEQLNLYGNYSYFNLDKFVHLKKLILDGTIKEDFNFKLFKKLCTQLEDLTISSSESEINDEILFKLFDGRHFSKLIVLKIVNCNIKTLKKKFIDKFPMVRMLYVCECNLEKIEKNAFSKLKKLFYLNLSYNCLKRLDKKVFSELTDLSYLILDNNRLEHIEKNMFSNLKYLEELKL